MRAKSNLGLDDGGFQYDLRQVDLEGYHGISASRLIWGERIEGIAREVFPEAEIGGEREGSAVTVAADFLRALLAAGPMAASELKAHAEGSSVSWASIRRAKTSVGVRARREGYGGDGGWLWGRRDD